MLRLDLEAPFAACRTFTTGSLRPTATFLTPSAVYGLLLNVAGIESRLREDEPGHDGTTPATLMRDGLPAMKLAIGVPCLEGKGMYPRVQTAYQQLHNYPVGAAAGTPAAWTKGAKNNIAPVRREFLSDVKAVILVDGNAELEDRIRQGLAGELSGDRYGLPFLGDNSFLLDKLRESLRPTTEKQTSVLWYERLSRDSGELPRERTTRLTIWIDRANFSRTVSALYAPAQTATVEPPESAWTRIPPSESNQGELT